jgi:hypothetical protein
VSNELLNSFLPLLLEKRFFSHYLQLIHKSINVFDQDVITSDEYFLLLLRLVESSTSWSGGAVLRGESWSLSLVAWLLGALTVTGDWSVALLINLAAVCGLRSYFGFHGNSSAVFTLSFVGSGLYLSLASSFANVLGATGRSIFVSVLFFVLFVGSWWQLHIITNLLCFGSVSI